jgi:glutamyl-tRNA reductase
MVRDAQRGRPAARPLLIVDIAVPRNVEPSAGMLDGVELRDLDYVQSRIRANVGERRGDIPRVEKVIAEEVARFEEWHRGTEMRPVLAALRARGEEIRVRTLARHVGDANLDPALREQLDALSRDLVTRLLHEPSRRLRAEADPARSLASAEIVRELFDLPIDGAPATNPAAG